MDYFSLNSIAINGQLLGMAQSELEMRAENGSSITTIGYNPNPEPFDVEKPIPFTRIYFESEKAKRLLAEAMKAELAYWDGKVKALVAENAPLGGLNKHGNTAIEF